MGKSAVYWMSASAAGMVVGSLGPWATVLGIDVAGTEGDGTPVLIAALLAAVLVAVKRTRARWALIVALLAGAFGALVSLSDLSDISTVADGTLFEGAVSAGWGLYLCAASSVSLVLAAIAGLQGRRSHLRAQAATAAAG